MDKLLLEKHTRVFQQVTYYSNLKKNSKMATL